MKIDVSPKANFYALLIGIDCYLPNKFPGGGSYEHLSGCVRDINDVEEFIINNTACPKEHMIKLIASTNGSTEPTEPQEVWPTYEAMINAFRKVTNQARPGDEVYIHYCGHGGRAKTRYPELKGEFGVDEALVPMDIGGPEGSYLLDVELAHLLYEMTSKALRVSIVLDSCHSGGATRKLDDLTMRGSGLIDPTPRSSRGFVASDDDLEKTWTHLSKGNKDNECVGSGWLPATADYVLIAACRPSEGAYEYAFDGKHKRGVLTYWLIDTLTRSEPGITYKMLHDRLWPKIYTQFKLQTPQLQGDGNRVVFASEHVQADFAVNVLKIDTRQRVLLNTGMAQGIRRGARFAIFPRSTTDFKQLEKRLALVRVTRLGATKSTARTIEVLDSRPIEQGDQAVLVALGENRLLRKVRLVRPINPTLMSPGHAAALRNLEQALELNASRFLRVVPKDKPADLLVSVSEQDQYEISDSDGSPLANIRPTINIALDEGHVRVAQRLVHLAKFRNLEELTNYDWQARINGAVEIKLVGKQSKYNLRDKPDPEPFDDQSSPPVVKAGEWIFLQVHNKFNDVVNVAVLDLQPDWGITQFYPADTEFWPYDPNEKKLIALRTSLPKGYSEGKDIIKAFGTIGPVSYHWLELPSLDHQVERAVTRQPRNPFEQFLAMLNESKPNMRQVSIERNPGGEWTTSQVEVVIQTFDDPHSESQ